MKLLCAMSRKTLWRLDCSKQQRFSSMMRFQCNIDMHKRPLIVYCEMFVNGGLTVVFGGDFQQILPVIVKGSRSDIVDACIQRSVIWRNLKVLHLRTNMRLEDDQEEREFAQWQLNVGHGMHTDEDANITIPEQFHCSSNTVDALVDEIYPGIKELPHPPDEYFSK